MEAVGLLSLGIEVCKGLLSYYRSWRSSESDVSGMYVSVEALAKTLVLLESLLQKGSFDGRAVENVKDNILSAEDGLRSLSKKLDKIKLLPEEKDSWVEKTKIPLRKAIYPFKKSVLVKLQELANDLKDDLTLSLDILQVATSASTLDRLDVLSEQVLNVSNGVSDVSEGVEAIGHGVERLQVTAAATAIGVNTLLSLQVNTSLPPSPLACEFKRKHHELLHFEGRQNGIARWLLGTGEYATWSTGKGRLMWCYGIPGAGKTVLSSLIIEHLIQNTAQEKGSAVAYLYCNYNDIEEQTVAHLLSCLAYQLLLQQPFSMMDDARVLWETYQSVEGSHSTAQSMKLLKAAVSHLTNVFIIIDALDECGPEEGRGRTLITELSNIVPAVRILAVSRDLPSIRHQLRHAIHLEIEANEKDILSYVDDRITRSERLSSYVAKDENLRKVIQNTVADKASGMFLQAKFHIDSLATKTTLRKLKIALSTLPDGLAETYDGIMQRISLQSNENFQLARKVLYWIANAMTPLTPLVLRQALAIEDQDTSLDVENMPDADLLVTVCQGLINIHQDTGFIGFVHYTTQEYFNSKSLELFPEAHIEILRTCLTFLSFREFGNGLCKNRRDFRKRLKECPLLAYAAFYWGFHASRCEDDETCQELILGFLIESEYIQEYVQVDLMWGDASFSDRPQLSNISSLHTASYFGMEKTVAKLLNDGTKPTITTSWNTTPLHMARTKELASLLLRSGAHIDSRDVGGETPLMHHAWSNSAALVETLLEAGADMNATSYTGMAPIHKTARNESESAASMLLDAGADVNSRNKLTDETPLHFAAIIGDTIMARLLLSRGARLDLRDSGGKTALMVAALHNHEAMFATLLRGLINVRSDRQCLATQCTSTGASTAEQLQDYALTLEDVDFQGRTVLMLAAGMHWSNIERLLDDGANPNLVDKQGRTCLHHAAARGSPETIARLLTAGLDPNLADKDGWTPLLWAAKGGQVDNCRVLTRAGADASIKLQGGLTPSMVALYHGHRDLASFLDGLTKPCHGEEHESGMEQTSLPSREGGIDSIESAYSYAICDGCDLDIHGPRSQCTVCYDFDLCFKCILTAKESHPPHEFEIITESAGLKSILREALDNDKTLLASR